MKATNKKILQTICFALMAPMLTIFLCLFLYAICVIPAIVYTAISSVVSGDFSAEAIGGMVSGAFILGIIATAAYWIIEFGGE